MGSFLYMLDGMNVKELSNDSIGTTETFAIWKRAKFDIETSHQLAFNGKLTLFIVSPAM